MNKTKEKLQKYPVYKDSGVDWLGEIPEGWEIQKLKFLGHIYPGISGKKGDDFSKEFVSGLKPFVPFTNICNNQKISESQFQFVRIDDRENQNRIQKNDILFLMSSETLEDIAKCSIYLGDCKELYLNSFCKGFRFKTQNVNAEYVNYLLSSSYYRNYFGLVGRGFTRVNLKQEFIKDAVVSIPPLPEQTAIANFLDEKTTKIDKAIAQKEKMIELLKERKQIIIQNAVTKGLDPSVKMKDSGVEWIGEIPEHWEVKKLKNLGNIVSGYAFPSDGFKSSGVRVLKISNIQTMNIDWSDESYVDEKYYDKLPQFRIKEGDLVFALTRPIISTGIKATIVPTNNEKILLNQRNSVLKPKNPQHKYWLYYVILDSGFRQEFNNQIDLTGQQPNISPIDIGNLKLPLPPIDELELIIKKLELEIVKIDQAITLQQTQIKKLKEYKATLIDSAVTGKIRVPTVQEIKVSLR